MLFLAMRHLFIVRGQHTYALDGGVLGVELPASGHGEGEVCVCVAARLGEKVKGLVETICGVQ
jgi:hypothetical protein